MSTVTFENVCRAHTKRQVKIKMNKFDMFITAVCVLFLIKLHVFLASFHQQAQVAEVIITKNNTILQCGSRVDFRISLTILYFDPKWSFCNDRGQLIILPIFEY